MLLFTEEACGLKIILLLKHDFKPTLHSEELACKTKLSRLGSKKAIKIRNNNIDCDEKKIHVAYSHY